MKQITIEGITQAAYDRLSRDLSTMIETGAGHLMLRITDNSGCLDDTYGYTLMTRPEIVVITKDRVSLNMRTEGGLDIPISIRHDEYSKLVF